MFVCVSFVLRVEVAAPASAAEGVVGTVAAGVARHGAEGVFAAALYYLELAADREALATVSVASGFCLVVGPCSAICTHRQLQAVVGSLDLSSTIALLNSLVPPKKRDASASKTTIFQWPSF